MLSIQEVKWDTQNAFDSVRREVAEKKDFEFVKNLILDFGFSDDRILHDQMLGNYALVRTSILFMQVD